MNPLDQPYCRTTIDCLVDGIEEHQIMIHCQGQCIGRVSLQPGTIAFLRHLFIAEEYRRRGLARQLVEECIKKAKEWQAVAICLHVKPENEPAIWLYELLGFCPSYQFPDREFVYSLPLDGEKERAAAELAGVRRERDEAQRRTRMFLNAYTENDEASHNIVMSIDVDRAVLRKGTDATFQLVVKELWEGAKRLL
jgi:GNAT superfamily N-acetyltransferase